MPYAGLSQVGLYDFFQRFLIAQHGSGKRVLLIVDEAQNLSLSAMESLRMLSNINADKDQLLQIILVGQPQLKDLLQRPELRQFAQRVAAHFFLPPLAPLEVEQYIHHRLTVSGRADMLFTRAACQRIAGLSRGIPRTINILCDTALVYGFSWEMPKIEVSVVEDVVRDQAKFGVLPPEFPEPAETPPVIWTGPG